MLQEPSFEERDPQRSGSQQQSEEEILKERQRAAKRAHPVQYTKDGTKYRGFVDLMWFRLRIVVEDGRVFEGVAVGDNSSEWEHFTDPQIDLEYDRKDAAGFNGVVISEREILSIEVLKRPEGEIGPFGPLPKDDDPYWDDDA